MTIKKTKTASPTKKISKLHTCSQIVHGKAKNNLDLTWLPLFSFCWKIWPSSLLFSMDNDSVKMPIENTRLHCMNIQSKCLANYRHFSQNFSDFTVSQKQ